MVHTSHSGSLKAAVHSQNWFVLQVTHVHQMMSQWLLLVNCGWSETNLHTVFNSQLARICI